MNEGLREDAKIIWFFLSKYKKEFYKILIIVAIGSVFGVLVPYVYGNIVALVINKGVTPIIFFWLGLWLIASATKDWSGRYSFAHGSKMSLECLNDFTLLLNRHSMNLELAYHNKNKAGKLSSRYIKAGDSLADFLSVIMFGFGGDIVIMFFALGAIGLYIHWIVLLIMLTGIFLYVWVSLKYSEGESACIVDGNRSYEEAYGVMNDSISNIKLVKSNTGEEYEDNKASKILWNKALPCFEKFWEIVVKLSLAQSIVVYFFVIVSLSAIVFLVSQKVVNIGQFVAFIAYLDIIRTPMEKIGSSISRYRRWMATIRRGYSLLEEETEDYEVRGKMEIADVAGEVEFKNISFAYNETREILKNISLKASPGEIVALVGESGVGKSTLMDLVSRYIIPTSGKILIDEIDTQKITLESLRRNIGIVPQDVSMFNDTLRNNLIYGKLDATDKEIARATKAANVDDFVKNFPNGLDEQVGERGVHLSGGQKQRVAIARAILKDPKILILDEATSSLDSKSEALVQEAMKNLMKGRTTFVIAHRLSTITHADKIIVLDKGKIAEQGTHKELLKNKGIYYKLYTLQTLARDKRE